MGSRKGQYQALYVFEDKMTYEYKCLGCEHEFEVEQKIVEPPLEECPKCKEKKLKRLISGGLGFQLKGGGWYKDGY